MNKKLLDINWIDKCGDKRAGNDRKEVALRINKSGLNADGTQRFCMAVRFTDESYKKASSGDYVAIGLAHKLGRMYFDTASSEKGFKLSTSGKGGTFRTAVFTIHNVEKMKSLVGNYDLLKDNESGLYYIDFEKK